MPLLHGDNWTSGWLPSIFQGTHVRPTEPRILNLDPPAHLAGEAQRRQLELLRSINETHLAEHPGESDLEARIASYALAAKMQTAAKEAFDISNEPAHINKLYGIDKDVTRDYGTRCLIARRMVERGVRFVHLVHSSWDHHSDLNGRLQKNCQMTDQPAAALVADLRQRGLLDETLVVWAGEFGRTPMGEVRRGINVGKEGRDHHPQAFSGWLAGGGVKPGIAWGRTDDFGFHVVEEGVHVHDLQATLLHLLGIDHERLTYRFQGRNYRLTDVSGRVVPGLLA